jgi:hypothetical protein
LCSLLLLLLLDYVKCGLFKNNNSDCTRKRKAYCKTSKRESCLVGHIEQCVKNIQNSRGCGGEYFTQRPRSCDAFSSSFPAIREIIFKKTLWVMKVQKFLENVPRRVKSTRRCFKVRNLHWHNQKHSHRTQTGLGKILLTFCRHTFSGSTRNIPECKVRQTAI